MPAPLFFFGRKKQRHTRALSRAPSVHFLASSIDRRSPVDVILLPACSERGAKGGFESDSGTEEGKKKMVAWRGEAMAAIRKQAKGVETGLGSRLFSSLFTSNDGVGDRARRRGRHRVRGSRSRGASAGAVGRQRGAEDSLAVHRSSFFSSFPTLSLCLASSSSSLARRSVLLPLLLLPRALLCSAPNEERGRRGGSGTAGKKRENKKEIVRRISRSRALLLFQPLMFFFFLHSRFQTKFTLK